MREKLIELLDNFQYELSNYICDNKYFIIDNHVELADHLIANGVVMAVNGHWITELDDLGWKKHTCSNCGYTKRTDIHVRLGWGYCPVCGAKMDEQ